MNLPINKPVFLSLVEKQQKAPFCWEWLGVLKNNGYGVWNCKGKHYAHRLAYQLYKGPINGSDVLHKCDNPRCVNPRHLFLGTAQDNAVDMMRKGRQPTAKLTKIQVRRIKRALDEGETIRGLAIEYGVVPGAIANISCGLNWKWV